MSLEVAEAKTCQKSWNQPAKADKFSQKGIIVRYRTELQNEIVVQGAQRSNMGKDLESMHDGDTLVYADVYH